MIISVSNSIHQFEKKSVSEIGDTTLDVEPSYYEFGIGRFHVEDMIVVANNGFGSLKIIDRYPTKPC